MSAAGSSCRSANPGHGTALRPKATTAFRSTASAVLAKPVIGSILILNVRFTQFRRRNPTPRRQSIFYEGIEY